jgi:hypothetical protein
MPFGTKEFMKLMNLAYVRLSVSASLTAYAIPP